MAKPGGYRVLQGLWFGKGRVDLPYLEPAFCFAGITQRSLAALRVWKIMGAVYPQYWAVTRIPSRLIYFLNINTGRAQVS